MNLRIRDFRDFYAGCIFLVIGIAMTLGSRRYPMGNASDMGPGWFPFYIGLLLCLVGVATIASGVRATAARQGIERPQYAILGWVLGGVVLFGALLQPMGLVVSVFALVMTSSRASHDYSGRIALINAALLSVAGVAIFVWGLKLPLPVWPALLR